MNGVDPHYDEPDWLAEERSAAAAALDEAADTTTDAPTAPAESWQPRDLAEVARALAAGEIDRPAPTVGQVEGGQPLFYAGKHNGIFSRGGVGKSMFSAYVAAAEAVAGRVVWWIDFEDDEVTLTSRLMDVFAVPAEALARVRYVRPEVVLDLVTSEWLCEAIAADSPSLVIVDSTGEWTGLHGVDANDDLEFVRWHRACIEPIAAAGPAVLTIDHLPHQDGGRLSPIGSVRKKNVISGSMFEVQALAEMGQGVVGKLRLITAKDRHGHHRRGEPAADFILDAREGTPSARLTAPTLDHAPEGGPLAGLPPAARRVHAMLDPVDGRNVSTIGDLVAHDGTTGTGLQKRTIQDALKRLEELQLALRTPTGFGDLWTCREAENAL